MQGSDLIVDGEIVLSGVVMDHAQAAFWEDGFSSRMVREALALIAGPVTVRVTSPGGSAMEGEAIRAALAGHRAPVTAIVEGMAFSAASLMILGAGRREITAGSMLMIHDPAVCVCGTEDVLGREAAALGKLAEAYARVYAEAAGIGADEARAMMRAETWMDADEAVAAGFCHAVAGAAAEPLATVAAARRTMESRLVAFAEAARAQEAATMPPLREAAAMRGDGSPGAGTQEERQMPEENTMPAAGAAEATGERNGAPGGEGGAPRLTLSDPATMSASAVLAADRARRAAIRSRAAGMLARGLVTEAAVRDLEDDTDCTAEMAASRLVEMVSEAAAPPDQAPAGRPAARAQVMADQVDRTREGMTGALLMRAGLDGGERNEFTGMTLREMARATLEARNVRIPTGGAMEMVGAAFVPTMAGGAHTTSDFGNLLSNIAGKAMLRGFEEVEESFPRFTRAGTLSDFKTTSRVGLEAFPSLALVREDAEFTYATLADYAETVVLATYGKMFRITRQAVINDDLDAFTRIPQKMGRAAKRTVGDLVFAVLTGNPDMSDTTALFHEDHGNLAANGAPPSESTINAAITAMATQTDRSGNATALNIAPKFLLAPVSLRSAVLQALNAEHAPDDTDKVGTAKQPRAYNTVRGAADPIFDARLTGKPWYMLADPAMHDTIEVSYLDGQSEPSLEQQDGWSVDGTEFKVRIDAAATPLAWETMYKNPGE